MTLEHVAKPVDLLRMIASTAARDPNCEVFIQVPNSEHILSEGAFWDVYYEHCNYFTPQTLDAAFARASLDTLEIRSAYDGQYLLGRARAMRGLERTVLEAASEAEEHFVQFCAAAEINAEAWASRLKNMRQNRRRIAFWGGASKTVSFLAFTSSADCFDCAIDINPRKAGTFLPGTGLEVVTPDRAAGRGITDTLVMNPIYLNEVRQKTAEVGLDARVHSISAHPKNLQPGL
jgi:uncharacterized protein YifE (UPF0438 family)